MMWCGVIVMQLCEIFYNFIETWFDMQQTYYGTETAWSCFIMILFCSYMYDLHVGCSVN